MLPTSLQEDQQIALAEHAAEIRSLGKRVIGDVIEIGGLLTDAKRIAGHGNWLPWLKREFGWSEDTAERFIQCHTMADQFPQLAEFSLPVSGLYLLAKPNTPDEAHAEVIERAEQGERLSVRDVQAIVDKTRRTEPRTVAIDTEKVEPRTRDSVIELRDSFIEPRETCLMRVRAMILDEWVPQIPKPEYEQFIKELHDEVDDIERVIRKKSAAEQAKTEREKTAEAQPTVPEQPEALVWTATPTRFDGHDRHTSTASVSEFKITPAGSGNGFSHYAVEVKPINADWSEGKVIGRFNALVTAKAAAEQHAYQATAEAA
jgi:DUF3102 family protein